jgi:hypothetical protein
MDLQTILYGSLLFQNMADLALEFLPLKILGCFKFIINNLTQVNCIADHLIETRVFAIDDLERISCLRSSSEKARKLLCILLKKPEETIKHFMDALLLDGTQRHIYDQIVACEAQKSTSPPQSETVTGNVTYGMSHHNYYTRSKPGNPYTAES